MTKAQANNERMIRKAVEKYCKNRRVNDILNLGNAINAAQNNLGKRQAKALVNDHMVGVISWPSCHAALTCWKLNNLVDRSEHNNRADYTRLARTLRKRRDLAKLNEARDAKKKQPTEQPATQAKLALDTESLLNLLIHAVEEIREVVDNIQDEQAKLKLAVDYNRQRLDHLASLIAYDRHGVPQYIRAGLFTRPVPVVKNKKVNTKSDFNSSPVTP